MLSKPAMVEADVLKAKLAAGVCNAVQENVPNPPTPPPHP